MSEKWYVLYATSGCEYKIRDEINNLSKTDEDIKECFVPIIKSSKIYKGKRVDNEKKMFPNYVFVKMNMNNESYTKVRNVSKVLGFLGSQTKPQEVSETEIEEYKRAIENNTTFDNLFEVGDTVKVIDGPFESFIGTIESKDFEKNLLKVSISIFGRVTVINIETNKVEKVTN